MSINFILFWELIFSSDFKEKVKSVQNLSPLNGDKIIELFVNSKYILHIFKLDLIQFFRKLGKTKRKKNHI